MGKITAEERTQPIDLKKRLNSSEAYKVLNAQDADASACRMVLLGKQTLEDAIACLSTSEAITVALAFGRDDLLPGTNRDFRSAWRRINNRQRRIVDVVVRAKWAANYESPACDG